MDTDCENSLSLAAQYFGLALTAEQLDLFDRYLTLMKKWNSIVNLTALKEDPDIVKSLFADSLALAVHVQKGMKVMDLGSGNGTPGIPLKIAIPSLQMVLLESRGKKVSFIAEGIRQLRLTGIEVLSGRAEDKKFVEQYGKRFDVVTARAVGSIEDLIKLTAPFLKIRGRLLAMKGPRPDREIEAAAKTMAQSSMRVSDINYYQVPSLNLNGSIVIISKEK